MDTTKEALFSDTCPLAKSNPKKLCLGMEGGIQTQLDAPESDF